MVGDDEIPFVFLERRSHAVQSLDPPHGHVITGAAQLEPKQLGIVGRVLDHEKTQGDRIHDDLHPSIRRLIYFCKS